MQLCRSALVTGWLVAAAVLAVQPVTGAQEQPSTRVPGWPCGARIDPAYLDMSEATGGQGFWLAPDELARPDVPMPASIDHPQTIFRLLDSMKPGVHEFRVPIDPSVESVVFSIMVQCLQTADVARPSANAPLTGGEGVTVSSFRAVRTVTVKRPEAGLWTLRVAGSGMASVIVQARSEFGIEDVRFAAVGGTAFSRQPLAGVENDVMIVVNEGATQVNASLVDGAFRPIASLPLTAHPSGLAYLSRFTPGAEGFRIMIEGHDAAGFPFQRVQSSLQHTAVREANHDHS